MKKARRVRRRRSSNSGVPVLGICYGQMTMAAQLGGTGRRRASPRIRPRRCRGQGQKPTVRFHLGHGRAASGLDEPWRPHHADAAGLSCVAGASTNAPFAVIAGRDARILRADVPPRSGAHARRRQADPQFRPQGCRPDRRLDHARVPRGGDREDPRPGRQGQGDLRPVRRRRFRRRRGADPRGDRRPAHLRVRRSRPACARTKARPSSTCSAHHYNIPLVHVDASKQFLGELAGVTDPEAKRKTIGRLFIDVFDAEAKKIAKKAKDRRNSWRRARSIPT